MLTQVDRQIALAWRDRRFGKPSSGPRLAVVGNCQSFGLSFGMKVLKPDATIDRFALVSRSWADLKILAATLRAYDHVFVQDFGPGLLRDDADSSALHGALQNTRRAPFMNFAGFHPDVVYLFDPTRGGKLILSPLGVYNSALALFAHRRGMSLDQAESLYTHDVFRHLGYLDVWNAATKEFLDHARETGLDLSNDMARWARRGNFMYTPNHPQPQVLFDIARALLRDVKLPFTDAFYEDFPVDDLVRGIVFPVYPPLAELYGFRGSWLFKPEHFQLSKGPGQFLTRREFIAQSHATYQRHTAAQLSNPRVNAWLDDAETVRALSILSAESMKRQALAGRGA